MKFLTLFIFLFFTLNLTFSQENSEKSENSDNLRIENNQEPLNSNLNSEILKEESLEVQNNSENAEIESENFLDNSVNIDENSEKSVNQLENQSENVKFDYLAEDYIFEPVEIPSKKRPKKATQEEIEKAKLKDDDKNSFEENQKVIKYGTSSEIAGIIDKIVENEDLRYNDFLYDLFESTKNADVKAKILEFFTKQKDSCLEDYAIEVLNDPYDYPNKIIENVFRYVAEIECKKASPCIIQILESENADFFNAAITTIGKIGGSDEALYMASYLERDDLELPQRQALMRTLGQICAVETWDKLVEIVKDEDENSFVRMYAAEAIGKMKVEDSVPILIDFFETGDPNMRQYCLKGLINFPDNDEVRKLILQATRDEFYKVRIDAIKACKELDLKESAPFLIYRAEKDSENVVKKECYPVLANLNTKDGNDFLISQITEKKVPDSKKIMASSALIENGNVGEDEILTLAKEALKDDKRKSLRNELGKLFIKYAKPSFSDICTSYLQSKDVVTVAQGLDMYKNGRYETAKVFVEKVSKESKNSSNKKKARKILGLPEEDEEKSSETEKSVKNLSEETDDSNAK